jgi:hypothetical protein
MDGPAIEDDLKAKVIGFAFAAAIIIGGCAVSQAGEIPLINSQSVCEFKLTQVAGLSNDKLKTSWIAGCQEREQTSLNKIKLKWSRIPDAITKRCQLASSSFGYDALDACLDYELQGMASEVSSFVLFQGIRQERAYWTHAECIEASGGTGRCVEH